MPWLIDFMRSIDPVARTLVAGLAVMLETSVLIGLVFPGDTVVLVASIGITSPLRPWRWSSPSCSAR